MVARERSLDRLGLLERRSALDQPYYVNPEDQSGKLKGFVNR